MTTTPLQNTSCDLQRCNSPCPSAKQKPIIALITQGGVTGILVQGSNGEAQHLMRVERTHLLKLARSTLDGAGFGHVIVIAGTGAQSTRETIVFCQDAAAAGAEFTLVLTPSTWAKNMNKDAILKFHRTVSKHSHREGSGKDSTTLFRLQMPPQSRR